MGESAIVYQNEARRNENKQKRIGMYNDFKGKVNFKTFFADSDAEYVVVT